MRYILLVIVLAAGVFLLGLWQHWSAWPWQEVPRRYNPFAPLHVADPPSPITRLKRERIAGDPQACRTTLEQAQQAGEVVYRSVGSPEIGDCQLQDAVRIHSTGVEFNNSFLASCPLAVAWLRFEQHHLQPAARKLFDAPVSRVNHYGSFACRNIYNRSDARRSRHATADALDLAGLQLDNGTRITVRHDWQQDDRRSRFLHQIRDGACHEFSTVLGPDYNAAHADHFHLAVGGYSVCR
ncbi:hypothetical protein C7446_2729 [Kushneria sinocarnis]|uniref:Extensin-like C-terminal domain-containing protein n=1 Tax=Kushneria sinocarnis TaxID=595502 RepID=A0A420WTT4_9GAMM|nr:extensin family protein [Kushneria sinocarnis]RKQ96869.1 hypothetical protein C7446_2729 [Kushneria sinocarnis]